MKRRSCWVSVEFFVTRCAISAVFSLDCMAGRAQYKGNARMKEKNDTEEETPLDWQK